MKVQDLIALLSDPRINPDAEVLVWFDHERCVLDPELPVDQWNFGKYLDLNVIAPSAKQEAA